MKKKLAAMVLVVVMAVGLLSLSACGGSGKSPDGSADPAASGHPAASDASSPSPGPSNKPAGDVLDSGKAPERRAIIPLRSAAILVYGGGNYKGHFAKLGKCGRSLRFNVNGDGLFSLQES